MTKFKENDNFLKPPFRVMERYANEGEKPENYR